MSLPLPAPIPPANVRLSLAPDEWNACLDAWLSLNQLYLRLPLSQFKRAADPKNALASFLKSHYHEVANASIGDTSLRDSPTAQELLRVSFRLIHRICFESGHGDGLVNWELICNVCTIHRKSTPLSNLLVKLWELQQPTFEKLLQTKKNSLTKALDSSNPSIAVDDLRRLTILMYAFPDASAVFMTGSDFLDALITAYANDSVTVELRKNIVSTIFTGSIAMAKLEPPRTSLLADQLYNLKINADQASKSTSLLSDVVADTPLVTVLQDSLVGKMPDRLSKLLNTAETYRRPGLAQHRSRSSRTPNRAKGKQRQSDNELHVHQMSLVTQIQDLFPDLGSGFILKLLDEYNDNTEQVTAHLLDDSLPSHLRDLDRSEQAPGVFDKSSSPEVDHLAPRSTPPLEEQFIPERRNVYDDDEFDRLDVSAGRLHIGKKEVSLGEGQQNKAAILSALAAFDSDDDERDDTYDVDDVGGTIDTAHADGEPGPASKATQDEDDMALFAIFKAHPELFGRTFDVRRGQARQQLKRDTGMTDEAIEGWAIMIQRDPRRLNRLEARFGAFDGKQSALPGTAYRESPGGTETEDDSDTPKGIGERGGFRGRARGRGRGGRGRGGNVAGPSNDAGTAAAQRNKEANKSRRANHNRRDQRAKKMARGGFPG